MPFHYNVFDCHCDSLTSGKLLSETGHLKLSDAEIFEKYIQVFAICAEYEHAYSYTAFYVRKYHRLMRALGLECITEKSQLDTPFGAILALEGADALCGNLAAVKYFYNRGVRLITLTWNNNNDAGESIMSESGGGLTDFGGRLVAECERLGIVVDLSHFSDRGFYDVCEIAKNPIVCSHSDSRVMNSKYKRNITDEQFSELIKHDGVTGINFCVDFLGNGGDTDAVLSHIEHFCGLGGEKNIGIGSDFDGIPCLPKGCDGLQFAKKIAERLLQKNYSEATVNDILYGNFLRVFKKCLK